MVAKHLAMALLGSALIAAPALAQNQPAGSGATGTSPQTTQPATPQANQPAMNAPSSGSSGSSGDSMTQIQPGQWRASQLEGLNVYNENNEKIGDISEMLVDQSGKIQAVVVGVGGFLGIGEHNVAIPFDQVKFVMEPRTTASTGTTGSTGATGMGNTATTTAPSTTGSTGTTAATDSGSADRTSPDHAMVNMTKDQLKSMPEFKMSR